MDRPKTYLGFIIIGIVFAGWCFLLYSQSPMKESGFGIYLLENNSLIVSDEDIVSYNQTSHEIRLTKERIGKIEETQASLYGRFVVRINDDEILNFKNPKTEGYRTTLCGWSCQLRKI